MQTLTINTPSCASTIYCGSGAFAARTALLNRERLFVITDSNVKKLYGGLIEQTFGNAPCHVLPAGERSKNYRRLMQILAAMLSAGVTRSYTVVALGGGVVGDIAGLAASLYMRGVDLVQIPTTLLAQVDSSVGGKTAVDFNGVKNIIGAFYQPREVIVDPMFLSTLPRRELRCGLGEIIKYGALDSDIYGRLTAQDNLFDAAFLEDMTFACISHKAAVVCADERDTGGQRKTLNLGHTTGHAFELYYKRRSHGEYVLIGMYYELFIAQKTGRCAPEYARSLVELIKKVIKKVPAFADAESAAGFAKYDKKNAESSHISLIAPGAVGGSVEIILPAEEYCHYIAQCRDSLIQEEDKHA